MLSLPRHSFSLKKIFKFNEIHVCFLTSPWQQVTCCWFVAVFSHLSLSESPHSLKKVPGPLLQSFLVASRLRSCLLLKDFNGVQISSAKMCWCFMIAPSVYQTNWVLDDKDKKWISGLIFRGKICDTNNLSNSNWSHYSHWKPPQKRDVLKCLGILLKNKTVEKKHRFLYRFFSIFKGTNFKETHSYFWCLGKTTKSGANLPKKARKSSIIMNMMLLVAPERNEWVGWNSMF